MFESSMALVSHMLTDYSVLVNKVRKSQVELLPAEFNKKFPIRTVFESIENLPKFKMSLTIDQQRQRVEQEITRMVDDLDKSAMRKMQVIFPILVSMVLTIRMEGCIQ